MKSLLVLALALAAVSSAQYGRMRRTVPGVPSNVPSTARKDVIVTFQGKLKQVKKKEILIQSDDNQLLTFRRAKTTKFTQDGKDIKATDIDLETPVTIEANEDVDLRMVAVNVKVSPATRTPPTR